jgi:hypothetical protein
LDPVTDPDPALFVSDLQDANNIFFLLFANYFLKGRVNLHQSLKIKVIKSHKIVEIKAFLTIFMDLDHCEICLLRRRVSVCTDLLAFIFDCFITLLGKPA